MRSGLFYLIMIILETIQKCDTECTQILCMLKALVIIREGGSAVHDQ